MLQVSRLRLFGHLVEGHPPVLGLGHPPALVLEREGEGLLPLQYAAAYRLDDSLVRALRGATALQMPGSAAWANGTEARSIKSQLRPVRTRVAYAPIAA